MWFFNRRKSATNVRRQQLHLLVEKLAEIGFYDYAARNDLADLQAEAAETGWLYGAPVDDPVQPDDPQADLGPSTRRAYWADAEDLAEGGVGTFLNQIRAFLEDQKVQIPAVRESFGAGAEYTMQLGDQRVTLYTAEELSSGEANIWGLTPARAFGAINRLLEGSLSRERLYGINAANDLQAVFLTDRQFALIRESPALDPRDKPYHPTEEHPGYGYPD